MSRGQRRESDFVISDHPGDDLLVVRSKRFRTLLSSLESDVRSTELLCDLGDCSLSICVSGCQRRTMLLLGGEKLSFRFCSNLLKNGDVLVSALGQSSLETFRFGGLLLPESSEGSGVIRSKAFDDD